MREGESKSGLISVISWRSVVFGFAAATVLAIGLGAVGAAFGIQGHVGAQASLEFASLLVGGFVAGRLAGRVGVIQGVAVAVIFILIAASLKAWVEIDLATKYGPQVLGPMDMGGLVLGDLVHLGGGFAGGWLADTLRLRAEQRDSPASTG